MSLAQEKYITASGWDKFDVVEQGTKEDKHLEFAHKVAKIFGTTEGKEVLDAMVNKYLVRKIVSPHDTQFGAGEKQGEANVIHQILAQIELSDNS